MGIGRAIAVRLAEDGAILVIADREPADEAPATPTDEPRPVPVQDPPVSEPKAPYTVTKEDIASNSL